MKLLRVNLSKNKLMVVGEGHTGGTAVVLVM